METPVLVLLLLLFCCSFVSARLRPALVLVPSTECSPEVAVKVLDDCHSYFSDLSDNFLTARDAFCCEYSGTATCFQHYLQNCDYPELLHLAVRADSFWNGILGCPDPNPLCQQTPSFNIILEDVQSRSAPSTDLFLSEAKLSKNATSDLESENIGAARREGNSSQILNETDARSRMLSEQNVEQRSAAVDLNRPLENTTEDASFNCSEASCERSPKTLSSFTLPLDTAGVKVQDGVQFFDPRLVGTDVSPRTLPARNFLLISVLSNVTSDSVNATREARDYAAQYVATNSTETSNNFTDGSAIREGRSNSSFDSLTNDTYTSDRSERFLEVSNANYSTHGTSARNDSADLAETLEGTREGRLVNNSIANETNVGSGPTWRPANESTDVTSTRSGSTDVTVILEGTREGRLLNDSIPYQTNVETAVRTNSSSAWGPDEQTNVSLSGERTREGRQSNATTEFNGEMSERSKPFLVDKSNTSNDLGSLRFLFESSNATNVKIIVRFAVLNESQVPGSQAGNRSERLLSDTLSTVITTNGSNLSLEPGNLTLPEKSLIDMDDEQLWKTVIRSARFQPLNSSSANETFSFRSLESENLTEANENLEARSNQYVTFGDRKYRAEMNFEDQSNSSVENFTRDGRSSNVSILEWNEETTALLDMDDEQLWKTGIRSARFQSLNSSSANETFSLRSLESENLTEEANENLEARSDQYVIAGDRKYRAEVNFEVQSNSSVENFTRDGRSSNSSELEWNEEVTTNESVLARSERLLFGNWSFNELYSRTILEQGNATSTVKDGRSVSQFLAVEMSEKQDTAHSERISRNLFSEALNSSSEVNGTVGGRSYIIPFDIDSISSEDFARDGRSSNSSFELGSNLLSNESFSSERSERSLYTSNVNTTANETLERSSVSDNQLELSMVRSERLLPIDLDAAFNESSNSTLRDHIGARDADLVIEAPRSRDEMRSERLFKIWGDLSDPWKIWNPANDSRFSRFDEVSTNSTINDLGASGNNTSTETREGRSLLAEDTSAYLIQLDKNQIRDFLQAASQFYERMNTDCNEQAEGELSSSLRGMVKVICSSSGEMCKRNRQPRQGWENWLEKSHEATHH